MVGGLTVGSKDTVSSCTNGSLDDPEQEIGVLHTENVFLEGQSVEQGSEQSTQKASFEVVEHFLAFHVCPPQLVETTEVVGLIKLFTIVDAVDFTEQL
jgi:hypothetical protein